MSKSFQLFGVKFSHTDLYATA